MTSKFQQGRNTVSHTPNQTGNTGPSVWYEYGQKVADVVLKGLSFLLPSLEKVQAIAKQYASEEGGEK